jgi:thiol-disulfide isomerase/thioredoxin
MLTALLLFLAQAAHRPYPLLVGDPAPPIAAGKWIPAGSGPTPGKPYVVEFWSAWCIPCIAHLPELTAVQRKYAGRVTIIGAGVWESEPGEAERFIEDLGDRIAFPIALDEVPPAPSDAVLRRWTWEHGRMSTTWLRDSGKQGIPATFIVDAQGRIAWIGEPDQMDEPLAQIVAGTWDLEAHAATHRARMTAQLESGPILARLEESRRAGNVADALAAVKALRALGPECAARHAGDEFEILLVDARDPARAYEFAREWIPVATDKSALNQIASAIINRCPPDRRDLDVALDASLQSVRLTQGKSSRTLKLLAEVYAARSDFQNATAAMRRAVAVAYPEEKPEFEAQLAVYEKKAARRD